ncbi:MAG: hypothetical protein WCZ26_01185, partial [Methanothrix soehngenii]
YGGIKQKWVLYHSKPMQQRMEKTFEKRIEKETKAANASLKKLNGRRLHANLMREKKRISGYRIIKIINLRNWSSKLNPRESMAREADLQRTKNLIAFGLSMPILNWMRKSLRKNALSLEDLYSPAMIWRSMMRLCSSTHASSVKTSMHRIRLPSFLRSIFAEKVRAHIVLISTNSSFWLNSKM